MDDRSRIADQLQALEAAAQAFDAGRRESFREIAGALLAIFQPGPGEPSLLALAGGRFTRLRTTAVKAPSGVNYWPALVTWSLDPGRSMFVCSPRFDLAPTRDKRHITAESWWSAEPIYIAGPMKIRRDELVRFQADPERAAAALPDSRLPILDGRQGWRATQKPPGGAARDVVIHEATTATLRQIAFEALHSPELLALAASG